MAPQNFFRDLMGFTEVEPRSFVYLLQPKPVAIVVSVDERGKPNGMTAAWMTPVSREPPLLAIAISPKRYTYEIIKKSGDFTVNVLGIDMIDEAEMFGELSGRDVDKFSKSRLTLSKSRIVKSPVISEALASLECLLEDDHPAGDHRLIVGRVVKTHVKEGILDGEVYDISKVSILLYVGRKLYTTTAGKVSRV